MEISDHFSSNDAKIIVKNQFNRKESRYELGPHCLI